MYRNRLEGLHWAVLEQDRYVLESMAPNAREHEFLYQHDVGMTRVRRMLRQRAQQDFAALEAHRAEAAQSAQTGSAQTEAAGHNHAARTRPRRSTAGVSSRRAARACLGAAFVRALVQAGAQVVFGDVLHEEGRAPAALLAGRRHAATVSSARSGQSRKHRAIRANKGRSQLGGIDALINNAAITNSGGKFADELLVDTWDAVMNVNVRGTWLMSYAPRCLICATRVAAAS